MLEQNVMREIPGFDGLYGVTSDGRVWSTARSSITKTGVQKWLRGKWLKAQINQNGYVVVRVLRPDSGTVLLRVHRAVALAWIPNDAPHLKDQVNHMNGVKTDNRAVNLEWCTRSENGLHAYRTGLRGVYAGADQFGQRLKGVVRKVTFEQATSIRNLRRAGVAVKELANRFNVSRQTISGICKNRTYLAP